jgi:hypothetical protein
MQLTSLAPAFPERQIHWPSAFQLGLSLLAAANLLLFALLMLVVGLFQLSQPPSLGAPVAQSFLMAGGLGLAGALILPSAWYAARRLLGQARPPAPPTNRRAWLVSTLLFIISLPLAILLGDQIARRAELGWLLAPFHLLAVGLPVLWLVLLVCACLGSLSARGGIFASGLVLDPT